MKKIAIFCALILGMTVNADAATAVNPRGRTSTATNNSTSTTSSTATARSATTAARSAAVTTRSATPASTTTARSATAGRTTVSRAPTSTTTSTANTARSATVAARAGTTQKVISTGTSVAAANENVITDNSCQQKYYGCMDSFCMLDNANGGRCICSDKNAEFNSILAEIEKLDQQSYEMATVGVDSIEKGYDVSSVYSEGRDSINSIDLSLWATDTDEKETRTGALAVTDLSGAQLWQRADETCAAAIPECESQLSVLQLMYRQQINNDCAAYENSLKQQQNASMQKLDTARSALVEASYNAYQDANKYDLGQCTVEFKNCMITTGGCGEDFAGCASVAASDKTNTQKSSSQSEKTYSIKGEVTTIDIAATTYDVLVSKKPLCEGVTKQCQAVASQVWDTFLKEVAPQIKSAELIAEDNLRQNCVSNISSCFQQACKDTMDPNDPDGSYDLCLTRPEAMLNLCKVPLNSCGISEDPEEAQNSQIWDFVVARLASMRVNSCATEFKECLQSEDRCGSDYTQCVGMDTDTIMRICPYDTLVGCQKVYGETEIRGDAVYDELYNIAQGIFLNIDNEMLDYCQTALDEAVIKACGDTETCNKFVYDESIGTRSLEYKICDYYINDESNAIAYTNCRTDVAQITDEELGRVVGATVNASGPITPLGGVIEGTIYWDGITIGDDDNICSVDEYFNNMEIQVNDKEKEVVASELNVLHRDIESVFNIIESDPTVQFCMTGREIDGIKPYSGQVVPRFPELTKQVRNKIAMSALNNARHNYYEKYDELLAQQSQDYATITERIAENRDENGKDARREMARDACVNMAEMSGMAKSKTPKSLAGIITTITVIVLASIVVTIFTAGVGVVVPVFIAPIAIQAAIGVSGALGSAAIVTLVAGAAASNWSETAKVDYADLELSGSFTLEQWNYRETITTDFDWENLVCRKCVTKQNCDSIRTPFFGNKSCKKWADPEPVECTDIQF